MSDYQKITPRMQEFLMWMETSQPIALFPIEWSIMWKKARTYKYIEAVGREQGVIGLSKYVLSDLGKEALSRIKKK